VVVRDLRRRGASRRVGSRWGAGARALRAARACPSRAPLVDCGVVATTPMRNLAVLASGQGTNFEALALAAHRGELGGRIVALLCDQPDAPVIARALRFGLGVA